MISVISFQPLTYFIQLGILRFSLCWFFYAKYKKIAIISEEKVWDIKFIVKVSFLNAFSMFSRCWPFEASGDWNKWMWWTERRSKWSEVRFKFSWSKVSLKQVFRLIMSNSCGGDITVSIKRLLNTEMWLFNASSKIN